MKCLDIDMTKDEALFCVSVAQRKWESLRAEGYTMQQMIFTNVTKVGKIDTWGRVIWIDADTNPQPEVVSHHGSPELQALILGKLTAQPKADREAGIQAVIAAAKHYTSSTHEYRWTREGQDSAYQELEAAIRKLAEGTNHVR